MSKLKIFISSNQKEFESERVKLNELINENKHYNRFFEAFIFEINGPEGIGSEEVFKREVNDSNIFIGLIGNEYGSIMDNGISATECEFDLFRLGSNALNTYMFILEDIDADDNTKNFIGKIKSVKYSRFNKSNLVDKIEETITSFISRELASSLENFDEKVNQESSIDDLDLEQVNYFRKESGKSQITEETLKDFILDIAKVGVKSNGKINITNAGLLFFGKNPKKFIRQHEIKMVRFQGTDRVHVIDSCEISYPMLKMLDEADAFIKKQTNMGQRIEGFNRIDMPEYPYEALREATINALAHRDYKLDTSSIALYIYKNRVEITNPGGLKPPMTLKLIKQEANHYEHRNEKICDLFNRSQKMEKYGSGITKMNTEMEEIGLGKPEYLAEENLFRTTFRNKIINKEKIQPKKYNALNLKELGLNDRQISALEKIINDDIIYSIDRYVEYFGVSRQTAGKDLNLLVEKGLIDKQPMEGYKKRMIYHAINDK
ncbi:MAG: ATP-binding protein [Methanobacteriaceae archaeon]